jgi:nanoRNase/pAp phosphatase (c-di-AMP/oligoRNAs hydrolase)
MLQDIASRLEDVRKIILLHGNADPDALGSAYALSRGFPPADICAAGELDRVSKVVTERISIDVQEEIDIDGYDLVVVVDTSSPDQLQIDERIPENSVVIDHHAASDKWNGCDYYCDDTKRSCAEIVLEILLTAGKEIDHDMGLALLTGMLTDSGHFRFSNASLLKAFGSLMEISGVELEEIFKLTDMEQDISERIAQLKRGQRLRFDRVGDHIVAVSHGSSYESSVSRSLLSIGADVSFVGSQREDKVRISARARQDLVKKGFHLGRILEEVGMETSNDGGGHPGAAGLLGTGDVEAMLSICMSRTMDFFREIRDS